MKINNVYIEIKFVKLKKNGTISFKTVHGRIAIIEAIIAYITSSNNIIYHQWVIK